MKKTFAVLLLLGLTTTSIFAQSGTGNVEATTTDTNTGIVVTTTSSGNIETTDTTQNAPINVKATVADSGSLDTAKEDISARKNYKYTYYYSETCSHCMDLNKFLSDYKAYSVLNIEKKEISNPENQKAYVETSEKLLGQPTAGTPFVVVHTGTEEIPLIGTDNVENYLAPVLALEVTGSDSQNTPSVNPEEAKEGETKVTPSVNPEEAKEILAKKKKESSDQKKMMVFALLIVFAIVIPVLIIKAPKRKR